MVRVHSTFPLLVTFAFLLPVNGGLRDILTAVADKAAERIATLFLERSEENSGIIGNVVSEGRRTINLLVSQLSRMGTNAITAANKKGVLHEQSRQCVSNKERMATELLTIKREELKYCASAAASLVSDVAQSFLKSNENSPILGNPGTDGCSDGLSICISEGIEIPPEEQTYQIWGTRLSAVRRCVQNIITQTALDFTEIFRSLRRDCLSSKPMLKMLPTETLAIPQPPLTAVKKTEEESKE